MPQTYSAKIFHSEVSRHRAEIMGIAIILIMLFHQKIVGGFPTGIFHKSGFWGVDIFLLLSGMGMVKSLSANSIGTFYRRRFTRLLPACLTVGLASTAILLIAFGGAALGELGPADVLGISPWFIKAIVSYYLLSPLLAWMMRRSTLATLALMAVIFLVNGLFFRVHEASSFTWVVERLFVFALGMGVATASSQPTKAVTAGSVLFLVAAVGIVVIFGSQPDNRPVRTAQMFAVAMGTVGWLWLMAWLLGFMPRLILRPLAFLGKITLEIYLVHEMIFRLIVNWHPAVNAHLLLAAGIAVSIVAAYAVKLCADSMQKVIGRI